MKFPNIFVKSYSRLRINKRLRNVVKIRTKIRRHLSKFLILMTMVIMVMMM